MMRQECKVQKWHNRYICIKCKTMFIKRGMIWKALGKTVRDCVNTSWQLASQHLLQLSSNCRCLSQDMGGRKEGEGRREESFWVQTFYLCFFWVTFFTHILILFECLLCATLQLATLCAKVTRTLNFLLKKLKPTFHSAGSRHSDRDSDLSGYIKGLFLESPKPWRLLELCLLSRPLF